MPSKEKKHGCQNVPSDKISNLPDHVLNDILMCLKFRDVVRTSVLSKKWRYTWCSLPQFELDETLYKSPVHFTNFMHQILTFHEGPITKLTFHTRAVEIDNISKIDNFICFLSRNGIQHLVLRFSWGKSYVLPSSLFACSQLRHLTLESCSVQLLPHEFKGFDRLISLELYLVRISSKNLERLITYCPLLEHLLLCGITCSIEINAPRLRSFDYTGNISSIYVKDVPLLEKFLLMDSKLYLKAENVCKIAKLFESLSSLKHLQLSNTFLSPRAGEVPTTLPFVLHSVKELHVNFFNAYDVVLCSLRLMRSFPCLQYLEIEVFDFDDTIPAPVSPEVLEHFSDLKFNHLREVKLVDTKFEKQLIKLLLAKSPVLVRMLIKIRKLKESARVKILDELSSIQPASPIAKIDFIF